MEDGLVQSVGEARADWRHLLDLLAKWRKDAGRDPDILAEAFQEITRESHISFKRQLRDRFGIKGCNPGEVEVVDPQKASEVVHVFVNAWNGDLVGENEREIAREASPVCMEIQRCLEE